MMLAILGLYFHIHGLRSEKNAIGEDDRVYVSVVSTQLSDTALHIKAEETDDQVIYLGGAVSADVDISIGIKHRISAA